MNFSKGIKRKHQLKPFTIPKGLILVQDSREQRPLFDRPPKGLTVVTDTLHDGDYSIRGFEQQFCIERKQMSDFYSYIGKERKRTVKKIERMAKFAFAGLVIEASEADVLAGHVMSQVPPEVARQTLVSFEIRCGIHVYYNRSRGDIARWCLDRMVKFWKVAHEVR